ncbi:MAG: YSIRK-type signal peptide-containing protein [Thermoanaerobaculia bacterium]
MAYPLTCSIRRFSFGTASAVAASATARNSRRVRRRDTMTKSNSGSDLSTCQLLRRVHNFTDLTPA